MASAPQASDSGTKRQSRYYAADFQRLTVRRRVSSPHLTTPDFTRIAQEPLAARSSGAGAFAPAAGHPAVVGSTAIPRRTIESSHRQAWVPASGILSRQSSKSSSSSTVSRAAIRRPAEGVARGGSNGPSAGGGGGGGGLEGDDGTSSNIDGKNWDHRSSRDINPSGNSSNRKNSTDTAGDSRNSSVSRHFGNGQGRPSTSLLKQCVAEDDHGIAQSFLESVNASICEPARDGFSPSSPTSSIASSHGFNASGHGSGHVGEATSPQQQPVDTCECSCRCGRGASRQSFGGGKRRSKSYTALRSAVSEWSGWDLDSTTKPALLELPTPAIATKPQIFGPGESPLEKLPAEVLDDIIAQLALDLPPSSYAPRNVDLIACLLTSKTIHVATINTLYKHITVPHSSIFSKFLQHIREYPGLGTLVRRLDLSHFTSVGLGRSRQLNSEIQNVTSKTLAQCLQLAPAIKEILLQENLDDDIDALLLHKIFFDLPKLRAVDFCASASPSFVDSFASLTASLRELPDHRLDLKRLSLHECFTLSSATFETLLPRLPSLTHLDVSHTRITDAALASLPATAPLTHLNLGRCTHVTGAGVADFLVGHPAAQGLVYLNLSCDIARYRLLYEADVDRILPVLPTTLRSLNLNGAQIVPHHLPRLRAIASHVEELGMASAELSLVDINSLFQRPGGSRASSPAPGTTASTSTSAEDAAAAASWTPPQIHYLDLSNISSVTQSSLFNTPVTSNILLTSATIPLEVIELGDKAISSLRECKNTNKRLGWCVKELGRRGWYVREPPPPPLESTAAMTTAPAVTRDVGRRAWKMGAMWWGMRKIPVAWGEVGGLYGHYMFKK